MLGRSDSYKVDIDVGLGQEPKPTEAREEVPFEIAVLGDFTGRANQGIVDPEGALRGREPIRIDADNASSLAGLVARLDVAAGSAGEGEAGPISLEFHELEDFHPDRLNSRVPSLRALREARVQARDPERLRETLGELPEASGAERERPAPARPPSVPAGHVLDSILDAAPGTAPSPEVVYRDELQDFVRRIVSPHLVPGEDPRQEKILEWIDRASSLEMRRLLHHSDVQALEALWRGLMFLVARAAPDEKLRVHLVDVSKEELLADLRGHKRLHDTGLYHQLVEAAALTPGGTRWALFVGAYSFGVSAEDLTVLFQTAAVAHLAGAPWIAAASPELLGYGTFARAPERAPEQGPLPWQGFRAVEFSRSLGLAAPRVLLRLPYGKETDPCETFGFEEVDESPEHEEYLWGNPAFAAAALLAESFRASGWDLVPGSHLALPGLPLHLRGAGRDLAQPCAETLLTERDAARMMDRGIMPLLSVKNSDRARLGRFQSAANPPTPLAAWWRKG